jgi:hypothetical protein
MRPTKHVVYSSRTADKFVVRLPDGMRERIAETARNHHRSMNSEIIARLEASLNSGDIVDESGPTPVIDYNDTWMPVPGMAVTFRKGEYRGQPLILQKLTINKSTGALMAVITGHAGGGENPIGDLMPFLVK